MNAAANSREEKTDWTLIAIGILKLAKSVSLLGLGIALIHWRNKDLGEAASRWMTHVWLSRFHIDALLAKLSNLRKETIEEFAIGAFGFSALLSVEGIGLCLRKRWAEFLTVGITASLLPFEFYELYRGLTVSGVVITVLNLGILVYLIVRLLMDRKRTVRS